MIFHCQELAQSGCAELESTNLKSFCRGSIVLKLYPNCTPSWAWFLLLWRSHFFWHWMNTNIHYQFFRSDVHRWHFGRKLYGYALPFWPQQCLFEFVTIKPVLLRQSHEIMPSTLIILIGSQSQEIECVDKFPLWMIMYSREKFGCPWKEDLIRHHPISLSLCKRSHRLKEKISFYENVSQRGEGAFWVVPRFC